MMTIFDFVVPQLNYLQLTPFLIVLGVGCLGLLIEAFVPRRGRFPAQLVLAVTGLIAALGTLIWQWGYFDVADPALLDPPALGYEPLVTSTVMIDGPTQGFWALLFAFGLIAIIGFAERKIHAGATAFTPSAAAIPGSRDEVEAGQEGLVHSEVFPLAMFALAGGALLVSANDMLVFFIGLEILSLPLYVMVGLARYRRLVSQEASIKYFLLGAMASAIILFGIAFLFGYAGGFSYSTLAWGVTFVVGGDGLLIAGLGLVTVGLLFKIGAVPFHSWVPDVYQGAPTPVTAFMSIVTKTAAVGGFLRLFYAALGGLRWTWQPMLAVVAIVTIVVGSVVAINQSDIKRVLAYSAISHAGFILIPLVGAFTVATNSDHSAPSSVSSIMFYLVAYGFAAIGAFAIVTLVRSQGREATDLNSWAGLGRRNRLISVILMIFLLSMAGIPLTAGFVGKYVAFVAAWRGGFWWLALAGVLGAVIAVYIYVRVIQVMFLSQPKDSSEVVSPGVGTWIVLIICLLGTLGFGLVPGPLLDALQSVSSFLLPIAH
jgi:NADH-quinone oxidoreductase subunit N